MASTGVGDLLALARRRLPVEAQPAVEALATRRAEPLRIAVAGRVKAGKSTLVNALVGERLAATGVRERTKVVTAYRWGHAPDVRLVFDDGAREQVPFRRVDGQLEPTLPRPIPEGLSHVEVAWPTPALRRRVMFDTPGIGASDDPADQTAMFLGVDPDEPRRADAVLYLLRHRHRDDLAFLEAFNEMGLVASPATAVGVVSRADEIGGGELSAMGVAAHVASRYAADPLLRPLCQTVVPVCGLLAEAAVTLTEMEARTLSAIARGDPSELACALRSVDDLRDPAILAAVPVEARAAVLERLGLFGVRVGCLAVDAGAATADDLAAALRRASGIDALVEVVERVFGTRAGQLTERSVLAGLADLAHRYGDGILGAAVEGAVAADHSWRELEALVALRRDGFGLAADVAEEAERLLGGHGVAPHLRLGLASSDGGSLRAAALEALDRWQRRSARPLASPAQLALAGTVVASIEGMLAAV